MHDNNTLYDYFGSESFVNFCIYIGITVTHKIVLSNCVCMKSKGNISSISDMKQH